MFKAIASLTAITLFAAPTLSQENGLMISAADPQGIVSVMEMAGYEAELDQDGSDDPMIITELNGWQARVLFYGCDAESHDGCGSLQLLGGFDRAKPWTAEEAIQISAQYRYSSVWLDEEGDPFIQWDIVTGDGIPAKVYLRSLREFAQALSNAAAMVFEEENSEEGE
ncbi:MAG TPA: hypothetical protein DCS24_06710 [Erythrobacter sp.]|nr:hypothetical protein [Erythrobacter sp.]